MPYSMKDILKFRKAAYIAARVSREENFALQQFCTESKPFITAHINLRNFSELARYFEPYLKGLTIEELGEIYFHFYEEVNRRRKEKRKFPPPEEAEKRLYPLGNGAYEQFAKYVWEKRGKPKYGSYVENLKFKWGSRGSTTERIIENQMAFTRDLYCEISTNLRSKKFLKLSIAD